MTTEHTIEREPFDIAYIHPVMQKPVHNLVLDMVRRVHTATHDGVQKRFVLRPFEGYRSPRRQDALFAGGKVTKARPWESAHQYGLAVDFAAMTVDQNGYPLGQWFWPDPSPAWDVLKRTAATHGLDVPIEWDRGHVQHPLWQEVKRAYHKREWNWIA